MTPALTEAQLQAAVIDIAERFGWYVYHTHDSRRSQKGWPDIVAVKPPRVLFIELKTARGRVRPEQAHVLKLLSRCDTIASGIIRPDDLDALIERLRDDTPPCPIT